MAHTGDTALCPDFQTTGGCVEIYLVDRALLESGLLYSQDSETSLLYCTL